MSDRFENQLFQMAAQEKLLPPGSLEHRVEHLLEALPSKPAKKGAARSVKRRPVMNFRRSVALAAVFIMLFSITAVAATSLLQQRMESMNQKKLEEYYLQIQSSKMPADTFNRSITDKEQERLNALNIQYEEEGLFPKGEIRMLEKASDYRGKQVAFLADTSTFFLPEEEMSDEELLQIIDFRHKRDYSLQKLNEQIAAGEIEEPEAVTEEPEATGEEILISNAVYEPGQELTIPYTGDLSVEVIGAGPDGIFLGGWNCIHKMEIGSSSSQLFYDNFNPNTRISALYQDRKGVVYAVAMEYLSKEKFQPVLWIIDRDGTLINRISLAEFSRSNTGYVNRIAVDDAGNIYLRGLNENQESYEAGELLTVIDREGRLVSVVCSDEYRSHSCGGIGIGKDGKAYTMIYTWDEEGMDGERMGIAAIDPENGVLTEAYVGIVPRGTIMIDLIAPGSDTDFVFWGYDGIFTYNLGDESAVNVLPSYEAPCSWEGVEFCALPDGRVVFAAATKYAEDTTDMGIKRYLRTPESTCFYYRAGIANQ